MKKYFLFKLFPPRPTFHLDMNEHEGAAMQQHMQYWAGLIAQRTAVIYGPVFDPEGVFGLGILEVDDEAQATAIAAADPSVSLGVNTFALIPMDVGMIRE